MFLLTYNIIINIVFIQKDITVVAFDDSLAANFDPIIRTP